MIPLCEQFGDNVMRHFDILEPDRTPNRPPLIALCVARMRFALEPVKLQFDNVDRCGI
jgi:hypothetical protein